MAELLSPAVGDQVKSAPFEVAEIFVELPWQMVTAFPGSKVRLLIRATVAGELTVQPRASFNQAVYDPETKLNLLADW